MGIRIHKALGYILSIDDLIEYSPAIKDQDGDVYEQVDEWVKSFTFKVFTDNIDNRHEFTISGDGTITECFNFAKLKYENKFDKMYKFIWSNDDISHIIFFPDTYGKYSRYDDDIDYIECIYEKDNSRNWNREHSMNTCIKYLPYNPYPYSNNIMDVDGNKISWDDYRESGKIYETGTENTILPMPPPNLTYWLMVTNLLNRGGCLKLKPALARWWC